MKFSFVTFAAMLAFSFSARADYLETSQAEASRYYQQKKAERDYESRQAEAAREHVYQTLSDSFASLHGWYSGEIKRMALSQPLTNFGSFQARLIQTFSTGDGFDCGIFLSFYYKNGKPLNGAILDCIQPATKQAVRKSLELKKIPPTII